MKKREKAAKSYKNFLRGAGKKLARDPVLTGEIALKARQGYRFFDRSVQSELLRTEIEMVNEFRF